MSESSGRTSRALALVQKVVKVTMDRRARGDGSRPALVERATVRALHLTSMVARQLARAPFPPATPTQRFALSTMSAQLRAAASGILAGEASGDRATVEGALAEVIHDTLALVDVALRQEAELSRGDDAIQVAALPPVSLAREDGAPSR
jgi:hypothetical protein